MAQLPNTIEITDRHRPCWYRGEKGLSKAIFHRWVEDSQIIPASPMLGDHIGGCVSAIFALIETENGTMREVAPDKIQFIDHSEFAEYAWGETR